MKQVSIDVLREQYPEQYDKEYERWLESVQEIVGEDWPEFSKQQAEHELDGTGWVVRDVTYAVAYSQGDGVAIEAGFTIDAACVEQQDQMRKNFPMCTEMLRLGYIEIDSGWMSWRSVNSRVNWEVDFGFWATDSEDEVVEDGVYKGLPLATAEQIVAEEDVEKFAKWLHGDVESAESEVYWTLRKDAELRQSEEEFAEWANSFDETFEVEE